MKLQLHLLIVSLLLCSTQFSNACTGGAVNEGSLSPTVAYQTVAVDNGDYFSMNVSCGNTYNFDFCANGGSAGSLWAEITILNSAGTVEYAFAPYAGGCTTLSWTSTFTGTIRVLISDSGCSMTGSWNGTMAYNEDSGGPLSPAFTISSTNCSSATSTVTGTPGGTFSFNPAPADAAVIDANTGAITNGSPGATYNVDYTICGSTQNESVTLSNGDASFSLSVICGGASASISGDTGGTFAFNPAPGDGSQINATTGTVTNGTVGTTYFVEYTVCGVSTIESSTVLDDNCWTLNGDAQWINVGGEQCVQMTQELNNQLSCAWNGSQIDFAGDFTLTLDYYFGDNNGNGADGNTFTFQPSASTACGTAGGQLGAGGIPNALVIEFDTYDNDNPTHLYDMACDHIAVEIDGSMQFAAPLCGPVCAKPGGGNIDDNNVYQVDINWISATNTLEVFFDGVLRLTCVNDFVTNAFGGASQVYWGATSATGGLNNMQYFCPNTVIVSLPVELASFQAECLGKEELVSWSTISENNSDYFELDYTYDGFIYYPVETVDAAGKSETEMNYSVRINNTDTKQRYYRLKMVDADGEFKYTNLLASKSCTENSTLISNAVQTSNSIVISTGEEANIKFVNQLGQTIFEGSTNQQFLTVDKSVFGSGIYYIVAETATGMQESSKIFIAQQ